MSTAVPPEPGTAPPSTPAGNRLPDSLQPIATEATTYFRELPRLLREGEAGRWALIKGNEVLSIWDTFRDATQVGHERFGPDGGFLAQKIDLRDLKRFAPFFPQRPAVARGCYAS